MRSMKRIMVATDMSLLARHAEARSAMLVRELGSERLDVLHIQDSSTLGSLLGQGFPEGAASRQIAETARVLHENYGIEIATMILDAGRAHAGIVRHAAAMEAGLVVLGAHGGSFIRKMFVGSTVDRVLRQLDRPVLIVKREARSSYRQVLVAVDFSESSRRGVEIALQLAPNARITVLHTFEAPLEARMRFEEVSQDTIFAYRAQLGTQKDKELREFISGWQRAGPPLAPIVEFGPAAATIAAKAASLEADLVVIGKHGQSAWEDMLLGSVTRQVIQEVECDVLVAEQTGTDSAAGGDDEKRPPAGK